MTNTLLLGDYDAISSYRRGTKRAWFAANMKNHIAAYTTTLVRQALQQGRFVSQGPFEYHTCGTSRPLAL